MTEKTHMPALLCDLGLISSRSAARRVIVQGGVRINDVVTTDQDAIVSPGDVLSVGRNNEAVIPHE